MAQDLCKKTEEHNELKDIDFFKAMFWGEPIAPRKINRIVEINR